MVYVPVPQVVPCGQLVAVPAISETGEPMGLTTQALEPFYNSICDLRRKLDVNVRWRERGVLQDRMDKVPAGVCKNRVGIDDEGCRHAECPVSAIHQITPCHFGVAERE